jgi:hypothetical protein
MVELFRAYHSIESQEVLAKTIFPYCQVKIKVLKLKKNKIEERIIHEQTIY